MSSAQTLRSLSPSGTSPATIRCASPSAIAVLPTPGSPISTGLFFVRRERIWITRRISSSRPITGIELALLGGLGQVAAELRERLVGALGVLRRDALPAADRLDPRLDLGARHGLERQEEVLGRDEVVAHQLAFLVGALEHAREGRGRVRLLLAALHGRQRRHLALGVGAQRLPAGEELLVEQRQQQVLGGQLGVAAAQRRVLRGSDRLLALDCQLAEVHVPFMPV